MKFLRAGPPLFQQAAPPVGPRSGSTILVANNSPSSKLHGTRLTRSSCLFGSVTLLLFPVYPFWKGNVCLKPFLPLILEAGNMPGFTGSQLREELMQESMLSNGGAEKTL